MTAPPRVFLRGLMATLAAALFAVAAASPVHAHGTGPREAVPAAGAQVEEWPAEVRLSFPQELQELPASLSVLSPSGTQLVASPAVVSGASLSASLATSEETGTYTVAYSVLFVDGASLRGSYEFTFLGATSQPVMPLDALGTGNPTAAASAGAQSQSSWRLPAAFAVAGLALVALGGALWPRPD